MIASISNGMGVQYSTGGGSQSNSASGKDLTKLNDLGPFLVDFLTEAHPIMNLPKHSFACAGFHASALSRRHALKVGGLGLLGLTLPKLLQAEATRHSAKARAKSVIFLYQFGGPSHIDMFDMKPNAPEAIRGSHKPVRTRAEGIAISEHLPRLAKVMDTVTLSRSIRHHMMYHNPAS